MSDSTYTWIIIMLVPINSLLNPIIHSKDNLKNKLKEVKEKKMEEM